MLVWPAQLGRGSHSKHDGSCRALRGASLPLTFSQRIDTLSSSWGCKRNLCVHCLSWAPACEPPVTIYLILRQALPFLSCSVQQWQLHGQLVDQWLHGLGLSHCLTVKSLSSMPSRLEQICCDQVLSSVTNWVNKVKVLLPVKVGKIRTHRAHWQMSCGSQSSRKTWEPCWYFPFFFQKLRTKEVPSEGPSKISHQNYWQELVSLQAGLSASFWNVHGQRKLQRQASEDIKMNFSLSL